MDKTKDAVPDHLTRQEYATWLEFMHEFYRVTGATEEEVNARDGKYDTLFCMLRTWSEWLAVLRREQPEPVDIDDRGFLVRPNHN
jgi:hypothetical protein|tara:strand:- start:829 stop:1083 length:255 start_codon:yes stop_codon:yes gene_type:complete